MKAEREATTPDAPATSDRTILWFAAASLVFASLSAAFAWRGGLWATPIWLGLAIATWRRARRKESRWVGASALLVTFALLVGVAAFASSGGLGPALRTDSRSYAAGDVVGIQLKAGIRGVGYNLCPGFVTLEGLNEDRWKRADASLFPEDVDRGICLAVLYLLNPLFSATGNVDLPRDLPAGLYRLGHEVEVWGERRELRTPPFVVTE